MTLPPVNWDDPLHRKLRLKESELEEKRGWLADARASITQADTVSRLEWLQLCTDLETEINLLETEITTLKAMRTD